MSDIRVARRYAAALFGIAEKNDVISSVEDDLHGIAALILNDKSFRSFLSSPYTSREEKLAIADKLFSDRVTALTMQALRLMIVKGREEELLGVRDEFVALRRHKQGVVFAVFTSSEALDKKLQTELSAKLSLSLGKEVEAQFEVDPKLMGGVKVAYGNQVLDGTVQGRLSDLRDRLIHDVLKQN